MVVRQYRKLADTHPELFDPGVAQALDDVCARFHFDLDLPVADEPAFVRAELPVRLAALADRLASPGRGASPAQAADERDVRRLVLDLRRRTGDDLEIARAAAALAAPLTALEELDEAVALRREAFRLMRRLAGEHEDRWRETAAAAEALIELLVRLDKPAEAVLVANRLSDELERITHAWAAPLHAAALRAQARALSAKGDHDAAVAAAERAVEAFREQGDHAETIGALGTLAEIRHEAEDRPAALEAARQALDIARSDPATDAETRCLAWANLSIRHGALGDWAAARDTMLESVAAAPPGGPLRARHLRLLAEAYGHAGDSDASLRTMAEAVDAFRELALDDPAEHLPELALALVNLGIRHAAVGQGAKAVHATQEAVKHYTRLADGDPTWRADLAQAYGCLAERLDEAGHPDRAVEPARRCVDIYRQVEDADLGDALAQLGIYLYSADDHAGAAAAYDEAIDLYRAAGDVPDLALTLFNRAVNALSAERLDDALRDAREAVELYQRLYDDEEEWAASLVDALRLLGDLRERTDAYGHAITTLERAVSLLDRLYEPGDYERAEKLAAALHDLSRHHETEGRVERSLELMRRSLALYGELTQHDPAKFRTRLASAWLSLGIYLSRTDETEECGAALGMAVDLYREAGDRAGLAHTLYMLADHLDDENEPGKARVLLHESVDLMEELALDDPGTFLRRLARAQDLLASILMRQGLHEDALPYAERAADLWGESGDPESMSESLKRLLYLLSYLGHDIEAVLDRLGETLEDQGLVVQALNDVAQQFLADDRLDAAQRHLERASALWEIHLLQNPDAEPLPYLHVLDSMATLLARLDRPAEAAAAERQVVEAFEERAVDDPENFLDMLPVVLDRLADHLCQADRPLEALPYRRRGVEILELLAADDPDHRPALALAVAELGSLLEDLGHEEAEAVLDRARTLRAALPHDD